MEVIKLTTEIDDTGKLNINLPTNLAAGKVDLIVIVNPVPQKEEKQNIYNFDLSEKLSWQGDAVETQRKLRNEW
jgi:hypothetical protein